MEEIEREQSKKVEDRQKRIGLWEAAIIAVLGLTFLIFLVVNVTLVQNGQTDLVDNALLPVTILMVLAGLGGFLLIRKNRMVEGLWLIYMAVLIPPVVATLVTANIYIVSIAYVAVFAPVSIMWAFPRSARRTVIIATAVAVLAIIGIEAWHPAFRVTAAGLAGFAPFAILLGGLGLLALSIRQFIVGNIRNKLMVAFVVVAVLSVAIVAYSAQRSLSASLTDNIGNNQAAYAKAQALQIGQKLDDELNLLNGLALTRAVRERAEAATAADTLTSDQIGQLDKQWQAADAANSSADPLVASVLGDSISAELLRYQAQFPENVEVFLTDLPGVSIGSTDRTSDYLQADEEWWQTALKEGEYIGQPEYDASSKTLAVNMAAAVRASDGKRIVGVLRTTVNINSLGDILAAGQFGRTGHTDIYLPDAQVVTLTTAGNNAAELTVAKTDLDINKLVQESKDYFTLSIAGVPSLAGASGVAIPGAAGAQETDLIKNLGWQVVVQQEQAEALAPVQAQTNNILLLAVVIAITAALAGVGLAQFLAGPIIRLNAAAEKVVAGDLSVQAKVETNDETGTLAATFNSMVAQLREMIGSLEQRVSAATRNLTLAAEVGRSVSQEHNLDSLLKSAVHLIQDRFNLYYTQVYLLDPTGRQLVLRAGTGDAGQRLMSRRHSLPLDLASLNGTAAVENRVVIVENTESSNIHRPNPLLPDTRSEMVIPLVVRDRVVGTLDIQSSHAGALNKENLAAFEALAGQLAIAVENAALLAETESARSAMEIQSRRLVRSNWQDFLNAVERGERIGYTYNLENMDTCIEPVSPEPNGHALVATIPVLNEPIGLFKFDGEQSWSKDDAALVDNIALQLGKQVENLRLLAQADKYRAEAEQALVRLTRQGWEAQFAAHPDAATGFSYDLNTISPISEAGNTDTLPAVTHTLEVRGEKIGELSVAGTKSSREEVAELLSTVGEQLSTRVENLRLFEETERSQVEVEKRARQLAAVAEVSTVSARELNVDKMLSSVVSLTQRQFGLYHAHIYLNDEKAEELKIAACGWKEGDEHEGSRENTVIALVQERSLVARAARTGQAVIVNDVRNEPDWLPNPLLPDTAAEMAVPLVIGKQVLGVLDVQSDRVDAFSEEDANIQTTLASQVAIALQNARSFTQAQRQAERETALNAISQQIQSATTVEAVLQIAARELGRALGAPLTIAQLGLKEQSAAGGNGNNGRN